MVDQVKLAIEACDVIFFVVDARVEEDIRNIEFINI